MPKIEIDQVSGVRTTGHEWDGIRELDNPMPRWWLYTFYVSIAVAVVWWVLYPSWPSRTGHLGGILGSDQRVDVAKRMATARAAQAQWLDKIAAATPAEVMADPDLLAFADAGGRAAFDTNCAPCHGLGGAGQGLFPTLADDDWLWGGSLEAIETTIRHGIRNVEDEDARAGDMPVFGDVLNREQIDQVAAYVLSLGGHEANAEAVAAGKTVFAESCAACHGEDGKGMAELGAPNLTDAIWLYGDGPGQIAAQIRRPRMGVMPAWQGRLDDATIKMLTVYVHALGGGR